MPTTAAASRNAEEALLEVMIHTRWRKPKPKADKRLSPEFAASRQGKSQTPRLTAPL
jgi:hypothetical protein